MIRTGIDTVEIFDEELRSKLRDTHPKNFIKTRIELPVYQIKLAYFTAKGNYKNAYRYAVFNSKDDNEYSDFWLDMFVRESRSSNERLRNLRYEIYRRRCAADWLGFNHLC